MPTTLSPPRSAIPLTPIEERPVALKSVSSKQMLIPSLVTIYILLSLSVSLTSISSSSSRRSIAMIPFLLILRNPVSGVFLIVPFFVTKKRFLSSSSASISGMIADIVSPGFRCRRLIAAVPLAVLLASGICHVFIL